MPEILGKFDADIEKCIVWRLPSQMQHPKKVSYFRTSSSGILCIWIFIRL